MLRIYDRKMLTSYCFSTKICLKFINTKRVAVQLTFVLLSLKITFFFSNELLYLAAFRLLPLSVDVLM